MSKNPILLLLLSVSFSSADAQVTDKLINKKEVVRIEKILSSDEMQGRNINTPGIDKAADFIAAEFSSAGLQKWPGSTTYKQEFAMIRPKLISVSGSIDQNPLDPKNIVVITSMPDLHISNDSAFEMVNIKPGTNLFQEANNYVQANKNYVVLVDTSFSTNFIRLSGFGRQLIKSDKSVVFVLTTGLPSKYEINASQEITVMNMRNVVGVLPGASRKEEFVIFSGHYDHLGIGKAVEKDSIFNGANDDAAGITAVIMLSKYYKAIGKNERTLVFAAFTAEEVGGFGSQYFSRQLDPGKVVAMVNIEMIGTDSKWGKNSAYITGYEMTDLGKILSSNLQGTGFKFYPDPYPEQQLFYRSDNATLARLGVPAHTISTSKMDAEKLYHTVNDEIESLDMENMTRIIKAIALSAKSIVNGKDSPSRVDNTQLR